MKTSSALVPSVFTNVRTQLIRSLPVGGILPMAVILAFCLGIASPAVSAATLVSVVPARNATGVAVNSTIVFTFDMPMDGNTFLGSIPPFVKGAVQWSANLSPSSFTYSYSAGDTVLTCTYSGNLPSGAVIDWEINAATSTFKIYDGDGGQLGNYTGSFTTAGGGGGGEVDYTTYILLKGLMYVQTNAAAPVPDTNGQAVAMATVNAGTNNPVLSATINWPPSSLYSLMGISGLFLYGTNFTNQAQMDSFAPAGTYTFNIELPASTYNANVILPGPLVYPPIPQVLNYASAQSILTNLPFSLVMNGFANVQTDDTYCLQIDSTNNIAGTNQTIFKETDFCRNRGSDMAVTNLVIPTNTLAAGLNYQVTVTFSKLYSRATNTTDKIVGHGALGRSTAFGIHTAGGGGSSNRPQLGGLFFSITDRPNFAINATANQVLFVQASTNLVNWTTIRTSTIPVSGTLNFEDDRGINATGIYYRTMH